MILKFAGWWKFCWILVRVVVAAAAAAVGAAVVVQVVTLVVAAESADVSAMRVEEVD